jgi:hypothetical protein
MPSKAMIGGVLNASGGWKLGITIWCSYWSLALMSFAMHPINPNFLYAESHESKFYCSPWSCIKLLGESGVLGTTSGWANESPAKTVGACSELEGHLTAVQVFGTMTFICLCCSCLNHTSNLLGCSCLAVFRGKIFAFHFWNAFLALVTWCIMLATFYRSICSTSLSSMKLGDSTYQLGPGVPQVFMVIVAELVQGVLCLRGAYKMQEPEEIEDSSAVMLATKRWKLGLLTLLSYATLIWTWVATNPLLPHEGWVAVESEHMKVYCNAWWCLQLSGKDGEVGPSSGWRLAKTLDFFSSACASMSGWGDLEQSIQLIQMFGAVLFITVAWSTGNHAANLVCDWLAVFRSKMFAFHFANCFLSIVVIYLMGQTYSREYCGEAIKDKEFGGETLRLGFVSFGLLIITCMVECFLGFLCVRGAYDGLLPEQDVKNSELPTQELPSMLWGGPSSNVTKDEQMI